MKIKDIESLKQLSSMGNETIKVVITLENGINSAIVVPAGISAGKYEAKNISANEALAQIGSIKDTLLATDWEQTTFDKQLLSLNLAGNTSLALSASFWKAINIIEKIVSYQKFPKLLMLLFEGGKHGNPNLTIQEFMLVESSLTQAIADFKTMRQYLISQNMETTVGAEGGFSPMNFNNHLVLEVMKTVFPNNQFALDAAGSFKEDQEEEYTALLNNYSILSLEDPFSDEAWEKWSSFFLKYGKDKLIVGDDLTVTNPTRIQKAVQEKAINAVIIKPNQNGTISGTLEAIELARKNNIKVIVSHRGEETDDDWIVDFALSVQADYAKFGGIDRGERIAKYNRLMELGMK